MNQLFRIAGFIPFLLIVFVNAFVDLGHKIIIQNTVFKVFDDQTQIILTAVVNALILLPFIFLFSPAGWLSDRFAKPKVIRASAGFAILITLLITASYYLGWFNVAFVMTLLLAAQSAIYSPAKYGYIREMVGKAELAQANGFVQAITIIAILSGIFAFSILFELRLAGMEQFQVDNVLQHIAPVGWILVVLSVIEFLLALKLCSQHGHSATTNTPGSTTEFDWSRYLRGSYLKRNLGALFASKTIWMSIIGLSIFWGISQVLLAAFPAHAKTNLGMTNTILVQGLLACSGIGIALGSLIAGRASRHHIETGLIPLGALGILLGLLLLPTMESPLTIGLMFAFLGCSGGMFIVPLNALIQFHAPAEKLGTILAGNNWIQNLVMISFLIITLIVAYLGLNALGLFWFLSAIALFGTLYTLAQLPQSFARLIVSALFAGRYRVDVVGFNNLPSRGAVLLLGNHISWLDWAMVQIACPRKVRFVMHRGIYQRWYLKWFLDLAGVIPIAPGNSKSSLEQVNQLLKAGEVVCLFPEGAISRNGHVGEFKRGFERCVEGVEGIIVPFYLRGLWGSWFSRANNQTNRISSNPMRRDIIVAFANPLDISASAERVKQSVMELSISAWEESIRNHPSLATSWINSAKRTGRHLCMADMQAEQHLSGYRALTATLGLSGLIRKQCQTEKIGLMLPASSGGLLTNMSALMAGKTLVNLNYTASPEALLNAVEKTGIEQIFTSRKFITKLEKRGIFLSDLLPKVKLIHLEDLLPEITPAKKALLYSAAIFLPAGWLSKLFVKPLASQQPAAILFSSGSEGIPKGVMLSEKNIIANIRQVSDVLDTVKEDRIVATLPLFHAFGLTVTGLMPMVEGIPAICHPDPTDSLNLAKGIHRFQATILCATSTFLRMFNRHPRVHSLMLDSLRIVVAGAERLAPEVRSDFQCKFSKPIYEGYGTSETTPVASVNVPDRMDPSDWAVQVGSKPGTVGMPLPGTSFRIVDPDTLEPLPTGEAGLILIGGIQVMQGYLHDAERTAEVIIHQDGQRWYKSGDKGYQDKDGFLTIIDRYSRFAKIGGEMISLAAVEQALVEVLGGNSEYLVCNEPDPSGKGEKLVLLLASEADTEKDVMQQIRKSSLPALMQPKRVCIVAALPKLASGKLDLQAAKKLIHSS